MWYRDGVTRPDEPPDPTGVRAVRVAAGAALALDDLDAKLTAVRALQDRLDTMCSAREAPTAPIEGISRVDIDLVDVDRPGRPARPELVSLRGLPKRRMGTPEGRVAAIHAVAHIEANAVNLALDASHRFAGMPEQYHRDWIGVAVEEGEHFTLLRDRLRALGADYGDLPAHDGLWAMAVRTADDVLARMALVPRVLEARGLDVSPAMLERFDAAGDHETAEVLRVILRDEVGHVEIGSRWFAWCCARRGLEPDRTFTTLLAAEGIDVVPPLNVDARRAAGFSDELLARLVAGA